MLYREIIAVCSEIHTKQVYTQCGQNVELLNVKLVVHKVITGLRRVADKPDILKPDLLQLTLGKAMTWVQQRAISLCWWTRLDTSPVQGLDKVAWGQFFFPSTSVLTSQCRSTNAPYRDAQISRISMNHLKILCTRT